MLILQERGWEALERTVRRPDVRVFLPGPVLAESIAIIRRRGNASTGEQIYGALTALGFTTAPSSDQDLVRAAALLELSRDHPGPPDGGSTLSLGDALILAVAERLGHPILTRDAYWRWLADRRMLDVRVIVP